MAGEYNQAQKELTRRSLEEALVLLMEQIPFGEISVSRICTRAGVSRMAFYRHFRTLQDVLASYLADRQEEFLAGLEAREDLDLKVITGRFLDLIEQRKSFFQAIFRGNLHWILLDSVSAGIALFAARQGGAVPEEGSLEDYRLWYMAGGVVCVLAKWTGRDCRESRKDMLRFFMDPSGGF